MKKLWLMFGFPLIVFAAFAYYKGELALKASKILLSVTNPVRTMEYVEEKQDMVTVPKNDNSDVSEPSNEENPFENFDIDASAHNSAEVPFADSQYPIAELTYTPVLNDVTYQRQNCFVKYT